MTKHCDATALATRLGNQALWRPLELVRELLVHKDPGQVREPLARCLLQVDFQGKSVVDLGSNIGLHSFLAALLGAREVHALDFGPDIVRLGGILAEEHELPQVSFQLVDFSKTPPNRTWDLAMMLDIIGNNKVRKGRVDALMDTLLLYSERELLFNVRPVYDVQEELGVTPSALKGLYPEAHLREGRLYLLEYLMARHGNHWEMRLLDKGNAAAELDKPAVHCRRKTL